MVHHKCVSFQKCFFGLRCLIIMKLIILFYITCDVSYVTQQNWLFLQEVRLCFNVFIKLRPIINSEDGVDAVSRIFRQFIWNELGLWGVKVVLKGFVICLKIVLSFGKHLFIRRKFLHSEHPYNFWAHQIIPEILVWIVRWVKKQFIT